CVEFAAAVGDGAAPLLAPGGVVDVVDPGAQVAFAETGAVMAAQDLHGQPGRLGFIHAVGPQLCAAAVPGAVAGGGHDRMGGGALAEPVDPAGALDEGFQRCAGGVQGVEVQVEGDLDDLGGDD